MVTMLLGVVLWIVYMFTPPHIIVSNHYGYPCVEIAQGDGTWSFIVVFPHGTMEDTIPTFGLIDFNVDYDTPIGIYNNMEGCVIDEIK